MIHLSEPWLQIRWDEATQSVWMEWRAYAEGSAYRDGLDVGLALLRQKKGSRWLADLRLLGPVRQVDQQWTNQDWFPRALGAGVRFMAMVSPKAAVSRLSVKQIMSKVNETRLMTAYFDDTAEAKAWLRDATGA